MREYRLLADSMSTERAFRRPRPKWWRRTGQNSISASVPGPHFPNASTSPLHPSLCLSRDMLPALQNSAATFPIPLQRTQLTAPMADCPPITVWLEDNCIEKVQLGARAEIRNINSVKIATGDIYVWPMRFSCCQLGRNLPARAHRGAAPALHQQEEERNSLTVRGARR